MHPIRDGSPLFYSVSVENMSMMFNTVPNHGFAMLQVFSNTRGLIR